jgi:hypothetical protein
MIAGILYDLFSLAWFIVFFGCIFIAAMDIKT